MTTEAVIASKEKQSAVSGLLRCRLALISAARSSKLLAFIVPLLLLALWWLATASRQDSLIPSPPVVAVQLWDLAFGDIYDDAFSGMLLPDLIATVGRVYGAFLLATVIALPLGMLIGRLSIVRGLLEPTLQLLRPIPVTAWLPLSMIMFGLGARSAFFLVALGAFYPILVNTVFAVRSVEPRLFEAAQMLDAMTRERLQEELLAIWRATELSVVFVTHSLEEAIFLADRIVVMSPGPGRIVAEERITLERPRDVSSPAFNDIRRRLGALLHADHLREAA